MANHPNRSKPTGSTFLGALANVQPIDADGIEGRANAKLIAAVLLKAEGR